MSSGERIYRLWLRILPADFRRRAGEEMVAVFLDGHRQSRRKGSLRARARFWLLTFFDLLVTARHAWLGDRAVPPGPRRTFPDQDSSMHTSLLKDIRFALRTLAGYPGVTAVVVLTLALGIGANTAIFSVVDAILLRPLPLPESERLVALWADYSRRGGPEKEWLSYPNFHDARQLEVFEELGTWVFWSPTLTGHGDRPERLTGTQVSHGTLTEVLGVEPIVGRGFAASEDRPGAEPVVLLSHGLWQRAFAGDADVVGESILLDDVPHTVVGVMPPDYRPPFAPQASLWRPLRMDASDHAGGRGSARFRVVGRLRPGVDVGTARAALENLGATLEAEYPEANTGIGYTLLPLRDDIVAVARTALWLLLGAVAFVLLMACVNVANVLLARGTSRTGELAIRSALGAGRGRILRQLLTENLLLAGLGGLGGGALGVLGTRYLVSMAPPQTPRIGEVAIDHRVLAFTALVSLASVLVFGLIPALRVSRADLQSSLREGGRGQDPGGTGQALRSGLVVIQVGLALVLLVGAGLMIRTFEQLTTIDPGFEPEGVLSAGLNLPGARYESSEEQATFYAELERRLGSLPGVSSVGLINTLPLSGNNGDTGYYIEGHPLPEPGQEDIAWIRRITPGYLDTMGIDVVAGRGFTPADDAAAPKVILINESLARDKFDGEDPVGQRVTFNDPPIWRRIVGVVADVKNFGIARESDHAVYFPYSQAPSGFMTAVLRTGGDPEDLVGGVRDTIAELDPDLAAAGFATMESMVEADLAPERFLTTLMTAFAAVALILAVVGLYGVVSYGVGLRMHEMGVRVALGADSREISLLVVGSSLLLLGIGVAIGLAGAFAAARLMRGVLYGVSPTDPLTYVSVAVVLTAVGLAASALPALRAARVDPVSVLARE